MWNDLSEKNFEEDYVYDLTYEEYKQGCLLRDADYNVNAYKKEYKIVPELWQVDSKESELSSVSVTYYDKMIELCNSRGIKVIALLPPKISGAALKMSQSEVMNDYFKSRGVDIIDYNTYEAVCGLKLTLEDDYYDAAHLNYKGAVKLSEDLAGKLAQNYNLVDHRDAGGDEKYVAWNNYWDRFVNDYQGN